MNKCCEPLLSEEHDTVFNRLIEHFRAWEWVSALTFMVTLSLQIILYSLAETL